MQLTPENRIRLRATVFGKTEAGRVEFVQRSAGLTARQRAVFILLDGQKSLGEIETWLGEDEMLEAVEALLRKGLVGITSAPAPVPPSVPPSVRASLPARPQVPSRPAEAAALAPAPAIESAAASAAVRPAAGAPALAAAREFMAAAARKHLGLMAADLVRRIEYAKDESQLAGVIGLWHVSLRESKTGKPCAEGLLAEARALLA